jgi:HD-GYP domain-containing protein (c-di-GMP phosphodiesterase class II)
VDAYGAIIERRPYKRARSHEEAIAEIRRCVGSRFDPAIAEIFCQTIGRLQSIDEPIA